MTTIKRRIVVLGTGGTIAGLATSAADNVGYASAQVDVRDLLAAAGYAADAPWELESEQIAQIDSKDMDVVVWQHLAARCSHHLARADVAGVLVTHGTDTLEETSYFLYCVLGQGGAFGKPVVLTGAMRPGSSLAADGPQNLRDALAVAGDPHARGVLVVLASAVHAAREVQKTHTYHVDAFRSGDNGPMGWVIEGAVRWSRTPAVEVAGSQDTALQVCLAAAKGSWPRVEIVTSHAGADGWVVDALLQHSSSHGKALHGIVVAGTGNGTVHRGLEQALLRARGEGVAVLRTTRCANGPVLPRQDDKFDAASGLSPAKARVALMLQLLQATAATPG